ncbi:MAG: hypothetical protein QOE86_3892 [Solirubrobacteraceae bacterium]|jgi:hypothetical protein|nr:hypothetical protein [Solirubrobacteraceae bacterium]
MATQDKKSNDGSAADAAADRIRELNERIIDASRKAGSQYLDTYEKTLQTIADYQQKAAESSSVDWVSTIMNAQAEFTRQLAQAQVQAGREMLK